MTEKLNNHSDDVVTNLEEQGYFGRLRSEILPFVPATIKDVLDIGCATGAFGEALQRLGAHVVGVEINPKVANIAKSKLSQVHIGAIEDVISKLPVNSFDCLVMNDVIEHLIDPWATIKKLSSLLRNDGYIVGSIPNVRHHTIIRQILREADWTYVEEGIMDRTHLRFFTSSTIRSLFEGAGFKIETIQGINKTHVPWKLSFISKFMFSKPEELEFIQFAFRAKKV